MFTSALKQPNESVRDSLQDTYCDKYPFVMNSKLVNNTNLIMESLFNLVNNPSKPDSVHTNNTAHANNPPYAIFPIENESILTNQWIFDIIYDSNLPQNQLPPPYLFTLDRNDEMCVYDMFNDSQITEAVNLARNQKQKRLMINRGFEPDRIQRSDSGNAISNHPGASASLATTGHSSVLAASTTNSSGICGNNTGTVPIPTNPMLTASAANNTTGMVANSIYATGDHMDSQNHPSESNLNKALTNATINNLGSGNNNTGIMNTVGNNNANNANTNSSTPLNRTSLQVTFGLASTRGMFTGALAKTGEGAEKVKMILGKHGLLAEDERTVPDATDADNLDEAATTNPNTTGGPRLGSDAKDSFVDGSSLACAASSATVLSGLPPKDPLNLSNDDYYALRSGATDLARYGLLQHSNPAVELWPPFFPTFMSPFRLRQFHRVPLKKYLRGAMSQYNTPFPVTNLTRNIVRKLKEREEERTAAGGGEIFFMRTPSDLSASDGIVVLCEFSEEYPPLMSQVGMATRIINYYRSLLPKDRSLSPAANPYTEPPEFEFGSLVYVGGSNSPFLGVVRPGGCIQALENNMYRAPIYSHKVPTTDFLVIRNRNGISIRRVSVIFTVGQQIPLMEVPGPNSKRANNFVRDFLHVFILRLFLHNTDEPKRIKMEEIRKAFPNHSESSIRKRLKVCADFKRTGSDASWWVLRMDYRLPSEEEVRYLVSPEDCCAHYSMLSAELRLKDAGYGEKYLFVLDENQAEEDGDKESQPKMEDEVRAAPWNTTRAYLASQRGGCFLELHGAADPTGCGEAFSYSKASAKPGALFRQAGGEIAQGLLKGKRTVTGTDADLRKLHLRDARALLRSFGISEADLKTFKRWEIIDMVRFTSTERVKQQGEEESLAKFARGSRLSMSEQIRCYRDECQRLFDLQNRVLYNPELLSSDEELSTEEEDDEDIMNYTGEELTGTTTGASESNSRLLNNQSMIGGMRFSNLSTTAQSYTQDLNRRSEQDQLKLKRPPDSDQLSMTSSKRPRKSNLIATKDSIHDSNQTELDGSDKPTVTADTLYEASASAAGTILDLNPPWPNAFKKMLRIVRTYSENGHQYTRTELVSWSPVVEIYLKIRQTRNDEFIHSFVDSDNQFREQQRKEKRRLQDQLRRLRKQQVMMRERNSSSGGGGLKSSMSLNRVNRRKRHKPLTSALIKMRCGACGQTGHMRTNKECPMYGRGGSNASELNTTSTDLSSTIKRSSTGLGARPNPYQVSLRNLRHAASLSNKYSSTAIDVIDLNDNFPERKLLKSAIPDPQIVATAQALTSKPVCELLAEQQLQREEEEHEDEEHDENVGRGAAGVGLFHDPSDHSLKTHSSSLMLENEADRRGSDDDLFNSLIGENDMTVEGTKLKLSSNLTKYIKEQARSNLKMKIPRQLLDRLDAATALVQSASSLRHSSMSGGRGGRTRRSSLNDDEFPTSVKHRGNRRRIDPRVALNHIFEGIYKDLTQIPGYKIFMHPVKEKDFPNYYAQIENPIDLSQIRMKINENVYTTREEFLSDIRLIYENSCKFNGRYSAYTETATKMCSHVLEQFCLKELKLMRLESMVNPLLDEDDLVGLSYLLQQAVEAMRSVEYSRPFHIPVDKRKYPDYYKIISNPMDLSSLEKMIKENRFHSRDEFFNQADLILSNCIKFNGTESPLTEIARKMLEAARNRLDQDQETLDTIEANIKSHTDLDSCAESVPSQSGGLVNTESYLSFNDMGSPSSVGHSRLSPSLSNKSQTITSHRLGLKRREPGSDLTPYRGGAGGGSSSSSSKMRKIADFDVQSTSNYYQSKQSTNRTLRQRTSSTWYGADIEYDDDTTMTSLIENTNEDEDAEHQHLGRKSRLMSEHELDEMNPDSFSKRTDSVLDTRVKKKRGRKPGSKNKPAQNPRSAYHGTSAFNLTHSVSSRHSPKYDSDPMALQTHSFVDTSSLDDRWYSNSSNIITERQHQKQSYRTDTQPNSSPDDMRKLDSSSNNAARDRDEDDDVEEEDEEAEEDEEEEEDGEDDDASLLSPRSHEQIHSEDQEHSWNRHDVDRDGDDELTMFDQEDHRQTNYYSDKNLPVYLNEDTCFSSVNLESTTFPRERNLERISSFASSTLSDAQEEEEQEEIIAQDLQLTDSDNGSNLSDQGGELCTDPEDQNLTLIDQNKPGPAESRPSLSYTTTTRSSSMQEDKDGRGHDQGDYKKVSFFISSDNDDEYSDH